MNSYTCNKSIILSENDRKILSQYALDMSRLDVEEDNNDEKRYDPYGLNTNLKKT